MHGVLVAILLFAAASSQTAAQAAEWKQVLPGAGHILTAEAALGLTRQENQLQVADSYSHFTEVLLLGNRNDDASFLLIYQESYPTQAFIDTPNLSKLAASLKLYQGKQYKLGSEGTSNNHLGVVKHVTVTVDGRVCFLFTQGFGSPDQEFRSGPTFKRLVMGNYCPGRSTPLTQYLTTRVLAGFGIRGVAGPTLTP